MLKFHFVSGAPKPNANYCHAAEVGGLLFLTGQLATDPEDDAFSMPQGIEAQTHKVFANLIRVLGGLGLSLADVAFVRIFLCDLDRDYDGMNAVYNLYFSDPNNCPGRTTLGVSRLNRDGLIEVDAVAQPHGD